MTNESFALKLKKARAAAGLSQQGMADRMMIPKRSIENWETGERVPPAYVQRFVLNELEINKVREHLIAKLDTLARLSGESLDWVLVRYVNEVIEDGEDPYSFAEDLAGLSWEEL